jgi:hypothetical protein
VLLVGDASPQPEPYTLAAHLVDALVPTVPSSRPAVTAGSDARADAPETARPVQAATQIATDNLYADLDGDLVPDVAVGRVTAASSADVAAFVEKTLAYERASDLGPWRRRINVVAGVGGFGVISDAVLEAAVKTVLTDGIPAAYATSMTYASWTSPYCPYPEAFALESMNRLSEGCLFWVYVGHGRPHGLDQVNTPQGRWPILESGGALELQCHNGSPIAVMLACHTGAFDLPEECLAEEMLRAPGGPVAVLCGSRITLPYAMGVLSNELLGEFFSRRHGTLGELVLAAKRNTVFAERSDETSKMFDRVARLVDREHPDLDAQRRDHLQLFNLLGDPLLQLSYPEQIELRLPSETTAGSHLEIEAASTVDGTAIVELVVRRDRLTFRPAARDKIEFDQSARHDFADTYARANDARYAECSVPVEGGTLSARLPIPADAQGPCHVRVYVQGEKRYAMGSADLVVRRP